MAALIQRKICILHTHTRKWTQTRPIWPMPLWRFTPHTVIFTNKIADSKCLDHCDSRAPCHRIIIKTDANQIEMQTLKTVCFSILRMQFPITLYAARSMRMFFDQLLSHSGFYGYLFQCFAIRVEWFREIDAIRCSKSSTFSYWPK